MPYSLRRGILVRDVGVETLSVKQGIDSTLFLLSDNNLININDMEDNTNERQENVTEDVSLGQLENNQVKQNGKHTKKTVFIVLAVLLAIGVGLVLKPVQKVFFSNDSTEETKTNNNSAYKNMGLNKLRDLYQIQEKERSAFRKSLPEGTSIKQGSIIYDNDKYIDRFGMDEFGKYDKATRDHQYKESVVRQAIYDQYGEDEGLVSWLQGLTLQERIEFLELNYQASYNYENEWQETIFNSHVYDMDNYVWHTIEGYTIPIPKTMYLIVDTSFNLKYKFFQNDPSKNSSIIVNCHDGDYSEMSGFLDNLNRHYINEEKEIAHLKKIVQFRVSFMDEAKQMAAYSHAQGMDMTNCKGPDFVDIGGQMVIHAEYDQIFKDPITHVDTYSFYSPTKFVVVMTGYPVTESKESKVTFENVIRGIRRIK